MPQNAKNGSERQVESQTVELFAIVYSQNQGMEKNWYLLTIIVSSLKVEEKEFSGKQCHVYSLSHLETIVLPFF